MGVPARIVMPLSVPCPAGGSSSSPAAFPVALAALASPGTAGVGEASECASV